MTTLAKIAEQIKRLITGNPTYTLEITTTEIKLLIVQIINTMMKAEKITGNLPQNDLFPPATVIATYDNIPVSSYGKNRASSVLPAYPLTLPMNMGVWSVADMNNPDNLFIPLQSGEWGIANGMNYLPSLSGNIGYENDGLKIIYTTDITKSVPNAVTAVRVKLLITDVSTLGDYDLLPVSPEMEQQVIKEVFQLIIVQPVTSHYDDGKDPRAKN